MNNTQRLSLSSGITLAMSLVVGAGLMALPGLALLHGGPISSILGWVAAIALVFPLVLVFQKLATRFPSSDGLPFFAQIAVGGWGAYVAIFLLLGAAISGFPAMIAIVAHYFQGFFSFPDSSSRYIAVFILVVATYMNVTGIRKVATVALASSLALVVMVVAIILANLQYTADGFRLLSAGLKVADSTSIPQIWNVAALVFWGFVGWEQLTLSISDYHHSHYKRIFMASFAVVAALYLVLAATVTGAAMFSPISMGSTALFNLTKGSALEPIFVLVMSGVMIANLLSWMRTTARMTMDSARKRILPQILEVTDHPGVPQVAVLSLMLVYAVVLSLIELKITTVNEMVLLANQNLMVLYIFALVAFYKTSEGWSRYLVLAPASMSLGFFLSGFGLGLLYPALWTAAAYGWYRYRQSNLPLWAWSEDHLEGTEYFDLKGRPAVTDMRGSRSR